MKLTIIKVASLGLLLGSFVIPAQADWHYLIRTSGLAWSDGYHSKDQCPPRKPMQQHFVLPGYAKSYGNASAPAPEPYYFELNNKEQEAVLPPAPADPAQPTPATMAPNPQAQYKPRSRYFQALEQNAQQPLQARQPGPARSY